MAKSPTTAILVVAAGRGLRVGGTLPKQYLDLAGRPLLAHTLQRLLEADAGAQVLVVIHPDDRALYDASAEGLLDRERLLPPVPGGATRQASVAAGLAALAALPAPPEGK